MGFTPIPGRHSWPHLGKVKIEVLHPSNYDIRTSNYFVTVSKASPRIADKKAFIEQLDDCLRGIKKDGRYAEIVGKYGQ